MFSQIRRSARRVPRVWKRKPGLGPFTMNGDTLSQNQVEGDSFSNSSHEREQLLLVDK